MLNFRNFPAPVKSPRGQFMWANAGPPGIILGQMHRGCPEGGRVMLGIDWDIIVGLDLLNYNLWPWNSQNDLAWRQKNLPFLKTARRFQVESPRCGGDGGARPYRTSREVPAFRVSIFSKTPRTGFKFLTKVPEQVPESLWFSRAGQIYPKSSPAGEKAVISCSYIYSYP